MTDKRVRRSYTKAFRRRVVAETFEPGASVAAVARAHGINANMLFGWRRDPRWMPRSAKTPVGATFLPVEFAGPTCGAPAPGSPTTTFSAQVDESDWAEQPRSCPAVEAEEPGASSNTVTKLELTLRGGRRLLLEGEFRLGEIAGLARELEDA